MEQILQRTRRADVKFYASGKIEITSKVVRDLNLKAGDVINVGVEDREYYLYANRSDGDIGRHEAQCRSTNRNGNHLRAYSKRLCEAIINTTGLDGCAALQVGETVEHPVYGTMKVLIIRKKQA